MRRCFVLILACLILTGCANKPAETTAPETSVPDTIAELTQVPDMRVSCGDDAFSVTSENYSWTAPGPDGTMSSVIACGHHPLERYQTREFRVVTDAMITLSFPVEPDSVTVLRWAKDAGVKAIDRGETVTLDGLSFAMEEGSWIYQITVTWDRDTWSGNAEYELNLSR